ncbi:MAG: CinA family protein [Xanthomonadaceae bacterium]|nr:CinA family protein [Xanthomonadaceae bacterium]
MSKTSKTEDLIKQWKTLKQNWMTVESATGGAIAAEITSTPGASQVFSGSLVVYQGSMKKFWLDIDPENFGGEVGLEITEALAESALTQCPNNDGVLAITGHFGPDAPKALDGKVYFAVAQKEQTKKGARISIHVQETKLIYKTRVKRTEECVKLAIRFLADSLAS